MRRDGSVYESVIFVIDIRELRSIDCRAAQEGQHTADVSPIRAGRAETGREPCPERLGGH